MNDAVWRLPTSIHCSPNNPSPPPIHMLTRSSHTHAPSPKQPPTWPRSNGDLLAFFSSSLPVAPDVPWMSMNTLASVSAPGRLLVKVTILYSRRLSVGSRRDAGISTRRRGCARGGGWYEEATLRRQAGAHKASLGSRRYAGSSTRRRGCARGGGWYEEATLRRQADAHKASLGSRRYAGSSTRRRGC